MKYLKDKNYIDNGINEYSHCSNEYDPNRKKKKFS